MKSYPSISTSIDFNESYYWFDKLDGSNIRAEWSPKGGFNKFGSRTQLLVPDQKVLWPSIDAFKEKYSEELSSRFSKAKYERAVVFFEWFGPNSFAGSHTDPIDKMSPVVFDIDVYKKGLLPPDQFIKIMDGLETPRLIFTGKMNEQTFQWVRTSQLPGITFEGVIGKAKHSDKKSGPIVMGKIKTYAWLNKLKEMCNGDESLYNRLK